MLPNIIRSEKLTYKSSINKINRGYKMITSRKNKITKLWIWSICSLLLVMILVLFCGCSEEDDDSISFRGSAGCNSYFGSFQMTEEGLKAGPIGATEMACMAEGVMEQEMQFLRALGMADGYEISDATLEITYDGGVLIFTVE